MDIPAHCKMLQTIGLLPSAPITIIAGHYGVGKTNFTLNLALDWAACGIEVTLVDLDVVNPYFRSSDHRLRLEEAGVRLVAPVMAGTNLDSPSLSGGVSAAFEDAGNSWVAGCRSVGEYQLPLRALLVDAGGDDAGATALGRYADTISSSSYALWYVVNCYRNLTQDPGEAAALASEIEFASHLRASAVVNNSHLQQETDVGVVQDAFAFGASVAKLLGLPLLCSTVPAKYADRKNALFGERVATQSVYPVQVYVRTPWE